MALPKAAGNACALWRLGIGTRPRANCDLPAAAGQPRRERRRLRAGGFAAGPCWPARCTTSAINARSSLRRLAIGVSDDPFRLPRERRARTMRSASAAVWASSTRARRMTARLRLLKSHRANASSRSKVSRPGCFVSQRALESMKGCGSGDGRIDLYEGGCHRPRCRFFGVFATLRLAGDRGLAPSAVTRSPRPRLRRRRPGLPSALTLKTPLERDPSVGEVARL